MNEKPIIGYAILGIRGLYSGWYRLRKDMIYFHCEALGIDWIACKEKGDRVIKIKITLLQGVITKMKKKHG